MNRKFVYDKDQKKVIEVSHTEPVRKRMRWPFECDALGVMPGQQQEAREAYAKCGVSMDFNPDGQAIITGPKQYARAQQALGVHERNRKH